MLELHLPAPTTGWLAELDRRGIRLFSMMLVGARLVVWMPDCCLLSGVRMRRVSGERREAAEREAVEVDAQWRRQLCGGISADLIPEGFECVVCDAHGGAY